MNILILYPVPFIEGKDSFYYFYRQLTDWLTQKGIPSRLFFAYLKKDTEEEVEGIQLPDPEKFGTKKNVDVLAACIKEKNIHVLFNFHNPLSGICFLFKQLRRKCPALKMIHLIHSCPDHVLQLKQYQLLHDPSSFEAKTTKDIIIKWIPNLYLWLLTKKITCECIRECALHDATVLLSPSYIAEYLSLTKKKFAHKVFAIPNPLAPAHFYPPILPVWEKRKEIVFAGGFRKEKAIPVLLRIWQKVQSLIPEWKLTMIGDGERMPYCREYARSLQLQRIEFKGQQNARPHINQAGILCLTSVIEGFPTVFTEAMVMGVVPIGFDSFSAIHDMIDHWKNGVIIPAFDEAKYAEAIVRLASDDSLRYEMGKAAQMKVMQYDIERIAPMWMNVFREIRLIEI